MNFQTLQKVEPYTFYLDYAFRNAKKRIDIIQQRKPKKQDNETYARYQKYVEIERVKEATKFLEEKLGTLHKKFPQFNDLPEFYQQLAKLTINIDETKKSLAAIKWAVFQCKAVRNNTVPAIKQARTKTELQQATKQFYGRVSSIIKQIRRSFATLEQARKQMKLWPDVKTEIRTVAIAGYPNVGKSSLLKALTGTNPEIKAYAFTTKRLNVGYLEAEPRVYQVIDSPGTFDWPREEMNAIERQAFIVLEYLAEKILYVFDPSESCGYAVQKQMDLLARIKETFKKPIIIICSKMDMNNHGTYGWHHYQAIKHLYPQTVSVSIKDEPAINAVKREVRK